MQFKNWINESIVKEPIVKEPVYHSSNYDFKKFSFKNAIQKIIWFTSDKEGLKRGEKGAQGGKIIYTLSVDIKNPAGWNEYEKYMLDQIEQMGYDGVILPSSFGFDGFVFNPNQIKILNKEFF